MVLLGGRAFLMSEIPLYTQGEGLTICLWLKSRRGPPPFPTPTKPPYFEYSDIPQAEGVESLQVMAGPFMDDPIQTDAQPDRHPYLP